MVKFRCSNCGEREEKQVLPGKHAISGAISTLNRHADCCRKPNFVHIKQTDEEALDRNLRDMMSTA